jgi:hypothetical protein
MGQLCAFVIRKSDPYSNVLMYLRLQSCASKYTLQGSCCMDHGGMFTYEVSERLDISH